MTPNTVDQALLFVILNQISREKAFVRTLSNTRSKEDQWPPRFVFNARAVLYVEPFELRLSAGVLPNP